MHLLAELAWKVSQAAVGIAASWRSSTAHEKPGAVVPCFRLACVPAGKGPTIVRADFSLLKSSLLAYAEDNRSTEAPGERVNSFFCDDTQWNPFQCLHSAFRIFFRLTQPSFKFLI